MTAMMFSSEKLKNLNLTFFETYCNGRWNFIGIG